MVMESMSCKTRGRDKQSGIVSINRMWVWIKGVLSGRVMGGGGRKREGGRERLIHMLIPGDLPN